MKKYILAVLFCFPALPQSINSSTPVVGTLTNNNAAPAALGNVGALSAVANASQPTITEGNLTALSTLLTGHLRTVGGGISTSGTITANGQSVILSNVGETGMSTMTVYISGTWTGTYQFQASVDGTNYAAITCANRVNITFNPSTGGTGNGTFTCPVGGYQKAGVVATGSYTGTQSIALYASTGGDSANVIVAQGNRSNNASTPGSQNIGVIATLANAAKPTWVEGNNAMLSSDLAGNVRMRISDAALNDRGANVNASNQLSVSVDNTAAFNQTQVGGNTISTGNGTTGTGSPRVTIASDNTAFSVNAQITPTTSGGLSTSLNSIKAVATSVKSSAGQVYGFHIYNGNAAASYVQVFDLATGSVSLGSTTPKYTIGVAINSAVDLELPAGIAHGTAITVAATTTAAGSSAPTNNVDINTFYK